MKWEIGIPSGTDIVKCIAKLTSGDVIRVNYNPDLELWYYPATKDTSSAVKRDCSDIVSWITVDCLD